MNESDILRAGLKVVGCFVVIGAIYSLAVILYETFGMLYLKAEYSTEIQRAIECVWKWKLSSIVIDILRLILGLYLCTGAKAIVKMLQDKERL